MLKQMIINTYAKYLTGEALDKIIKNINHLVNEFVKRKTIQNTYENSIKEGQRRR